MSSPTCRMTHDSTIPGIIQNVPAPHMDEKHEKMRSSLRCGIFVGHQMFFFFRHHQIQDNAILGEFPSIELPVCHGKSPLFMGKQGKTMENSR